MPHNHHHNHHGASQQQQQQQQQHGGASTRSGTLRSFSSAGSSLPGKLATPQRGPSLGGHAITAYAEKVLFASVDVNALGILLEADARGNAAVVRSMLTPLQVEVSLPAGAPRELAEAEGKPVLEVGDVLFAVNGAMVHRTPHSRVLQMLRGVDSLSAPGHSGGRQGSGLAWMLVLSFVGPSEYYQHCKAGTLESHALSDPNLFGKLKQQSGWTGLLSGWWGGGSSSSSSSPAPARDASSGARAGSPSGGPSGGASSGKQRRASTASRGDETLRPPTPPSFRPVPSAAAVLGVGQARSGASEQADAFLKFNAGEFEQALRVYSAVLEREPLSHTVRVSRSMCYLRMGDPESALRDALTCCALKPEWPMPYVCKGAALDAMGNPMEACSAYACGLVVDPSNAVLRQRLDDLFARMGWSCIALDGRLVVGSVATAVLRREEWGAGLLVDRLILYCDGRTCAQQLLGLAPAVSLADGGLHGAVSVRVPDAARYQALLRAGKVLCELADGDEVLTVDSHRVTGTEHFARQVAQSGSKGVVVLGVLSGARIAATQLLEKAHADKAERALSSARELALFAVHVEGCAVQAANGVYLPQEQRNETFVYENRHGCLLSLEAVRAASGGWLFGWVIGAGGAPLYTARVRPEDGAHFQRCSSHEFLSNMKLVRWHACAAALTMAADAASLGAIAPPSPRTPATPTLPALVQAQQHRLPVLAKTSALPSLSFFIGDESPSRALRTPQHQHNHNHPPELQLSPDAQLLAIKGYGNRALARHDTETALKCFGIVEDQLEAQMSSTDDDAGDSEDQVTDDDMGGASARSSSSSSSSVSRSDRLGAGMDKARRSYAAEQARAEQLVAKELMVKVLLGQSRAHLEAGGPASAAAAAAAADKALAHIRDCAIAHYHRALALAALDKPADAVAACDQGLELSTSSALTPKLAGLKAELQNQLSPQRKGADHLGSADPAPAAHQADKTDKTAPGAAPATTQMQAAAPAPATKLGDLLVKPHAATTAHERLLAERLRRGLTLSIARHRVKTNASASKAPDAAAHGIESKNKPKSKVMQLTAGGDLVIGSSNKLKAALGGSKAKRHVSRESCQGVVLGRFVESAPHTAPCVERDAHAFTILVDGQRELLVCSLPSANATEVQELAGLIADWCKLKDS